MKIAKVWCILAKPWLKKVSFGHFVKSLFINFMQILTRFCIFVSLQEERWCIGYYMHVTYSLKWCVGSCGQSEGGEPYLMMNRGRTPTIHFDIFSHQTLFHQNIQILPIVSSCTSTPPTFPNKKVQGGNGAGGTCFFPFLIFSWQQIRDFQADANVQKLYWLTFSWGWMITIYFGKQSYCFLE